MKRVLHHDLIINSIALIFSVSMFLVAINMPVEAAKYPKVILSIMIALSTLLVIYGIKSSTRIKDDDIDNCHYLKLKRLKTPMISLLFVIAYSFCIDLLGFFTATALFLASFMYYCGLRDWKIMVGCILGTNVFMYLIFVLQLNVQFPRGLIF